jgi:hypothetical protein
LNVLVKKITSAKRLKYHEILLIKYREVSKMSSETAYRDCYVVAKDIRK